MKKMILYVFALLLLMQFVSAGYCDEYDKDYPLLNPAAKDNCIVPRGEKFVIRDIDLKESIGSTCGSTCVYSGARPTIEVEVANVGSSWGCNYVEIQYIEPDDLKYYQPLSTVSSAASCRAKSNTQTKRVCLFPNEKVELKVSPKVPTYTSSPISRAIGANVYNRCWTPGYPQGGNQDGGGSKYKRVLIKRGISGGGDTCSNDVRDGDETDIDCGGSKCSDCQEQQRCDSDSDCSGQLLCGRDKRVDENKRCVQPQEEEWADGKTWCSNGDVYGNWYSKYGTIVSKQRDDCTVQESCICLSRSGDSCIEAKCEVDDDGNDGGLGDRDTDGDGFIDDEDICPDVYGTDQGCPDKGDNEFDCALTTCGGDDWCLSCAPGTNSCTELGCVYDENPGQIEDCLVECVSNDDCTTGMCLGQSIDSCEVYLCVDDEDNDGDIDTKDFNKKAEEKKKEIDSFMYGTTGTNIVLIGVIVALSIAAIFVFKGKKRGRR